ncbi:MAG: hypothetical protein J1E63_06610, partial [Muribaculaceae bacterium]|nr:hypothetical protein [Muribaculaceae bacterium]
MKKFLLSLVAGIAVALTPAVNATETISFSYNANNDEPTYEGIQGITDYDIAILIRDTNLAGSKIKGFKVPVNFTAADVKSMSGWLSVTLRLDADGNNNPGICTQAASIADGFLSVTFDEPYEITKTGVYVGYSFSLNSTSISDPLSCTPISNTNAFYIHSANTAYAKWTNVARDLGMNVPMVVYIEGDFPALSVNCTMPAESNAALGDENFGIRLTIINNGANPVTSVGYTTTTTGDKSVSTVTEVNPPLEYYNGTATVNLALPEITSSGSYNLNVNVTTINGTTLATPFNLSGTLNVASHVVTRRPLVEEYTGLWCGWCPRGYVAMEDMSAAYGHEFVGLAYHNGDEMATV